MFAPLVAYLLWFSLALHLACPPGYWTFLVIMLSEGAYYHSCLYSTLARMNAAEVYTAHQGGITCGAIDEPRKSSKAIDERVIINFRDKNVVIARFRDKNVYR